MKEYRVAVALNYADPAARDVLDGIVQFARGRPWRLCDKFCAEEADGVIRDPSTPASVPAVVVSTAASDTADVRPDGEAVGRMAALHFLDRGFRKFAFGGPAACYNAFAAAVAEAGFPPPIDVQPDMFKKIDQPLAIFAGSDATAAVIADFIADRRGQPWIALLGVGNDVTTCELCDPPLSSIDVGPRQLGRLAAARLHKQMTGHAVSEPVKAPPLGVVLRQSTDGLAIEDADVAAAVRFIHENANGPLRVSDMERAVGLDRRTLERRFQKSLGCSPALVLRRRRVDLAADLLRNTRRPMTDISRACGFRLPQGLAAAFKQMTGHNPSDYRALVDGDGDG